MIELGNSLGEGVLDFVGCEEDSAKSVDRGRIRQLDTVFLQGLPDFIGIEFLGFRGVEQAPGGGARLQETFHVGSAGEVGVVDEGLSGEDEAIPVDARRARGVDFDADSGEGATFAELDLVEPLRNECDLFGASKPVGDGEVDGGGVGARLERSDQAVIANPKGIFVHELRVALLGILEVYNRRQIRRTGKHSPNFQRVWTTVNRLIRNIL